MQSNLEMKQLPPLETIDLKVTSNTLMMSQSRSIGRLSILLFALCQLQVLGQHHSRVSSKEQFYMSRAERFPSVQDRVKLYMSNWYVPPCNGYTDGQILYSYKQEGKGQWPMLHLRGLQNHPSINSTAILEVENLIEPDLVFFLQSEIVMKCANLSIDEAQWSESSRLLIENISSRVKFQSNMRMYCHDVIYSLLTALDHIHWDKAITGHADNMEKVPTLLQFGDNRDSHKFGKVNVPHIKKFRSAVSKSSEVTRITTKSCYSTPRQALDTVHSELGGERMQPIVWKLATHRHFEKMNVVHMSDTPWHKKKDMAVFRGQLTGSRHGYDKHLPDEQNCRNLMRCRLVYNHANSTLIHSRLTNTRDRLPDVLNGVELVAKKVDLRYLLEFKGIIMIEGNDVASGLKWAMLSQSVVLMPTPKHTSWAMEELLEPWVHYIPLDENATNVEERMQWVLDNDAEARRISQRGSLWMNDLVFHPDAQEDDRLIQEEILRRYQAHFIPS